MNFLQILSILMFFLFASLNCSTSVDFIPEPFPSKRIAGYNKKSWKDIEIHFKKPKIRVLWTGTLVVRNFNNSDNIKPFEEDIKKTLFKNLQDGVYFFDSKMEDIPPFLMSTETTNGFPLGYYENSADVGIVTGYTFRLDQQ